MLPPKRIAWFLFRLVLLYAVFIAPWPVVSEAYAAAYRAVSNVVFGSFGSEGEVRFRKPTGPSAMDSEIAIRRPPSRVVGTTSHSARFTGYVPTAFVISLILATPLPWSRRGKALLWAMLLVHAFIALRLQITLLHWFCGDSPWCLYQPSPFWTSVLHRVFGAIAVSPTLSFIAPIFIWVVATFRRADWQSLDSPHGRRSADIVTK
ncbi:MAG: hypothetical protein ACYSVY_25170 [Planctomycetota bacterium]|jgi:hypothetical protein